MEGKIVAAAFAVVAAALLAGCGSTRVVQTTVVEHPCSTETAMTKCVADLERALLRADGDYAAVKSVCKHATTSKWSCLLSIDRDAAANDAECYALDVRRINVGFPLIIKGVSSYDCPWST